MVLGFVAGAVTIVKVRLGLPVVAGITVLRLLRVGLRRRRRNGNGPSPEADVAPSAEVTLEWKDLQCVLKKKDTQARHILRRVSGIAKPGRMLAIMGPSGSGKTTLLNALAAQVPLNKHLTLSGRVLVNGVDSSVSGHVAAYVQQEDIFYTQLTVWETLLMAAELRLPSSLGAAGRVARVEELMGELGLAKVCDTRVGDAKTRGLSGGEKKRLSIGCELLGSPSLIFLDEPTTGLDAFQAEKVMSTLSALASGGRTVVCSIHQPRSSIFALFDDLLLLSEGQVVYTGPAHEVLPYFAGLGHVCPPHYNPAEFVADLISIDYANHEAEQESRQRVAALVAAWASAAVPGASAAVSQGGAGHASPAGAGVAGFKALSVPGTGRPGVARQLQLLLTRSWRQVTRDRTTTIARITANVSSALIFGSIFFRMRKGQSNVQDRMGLLQVAAINTAMSSLIKMLNVFPRERSIVSRERAQHAYGTLPYLTAKLVAELPIGAVFPLLFGTVVYPLTGLHPSLTRFTKFLSILTLESFTAQALGLAVGSLAPSTESALALGPAIMVVWIVFGGYYVNADNVPRALRWLPRASFIKSSFEALCVNEFKGLAFEADAQGRGSRTGEQVLELLSFHRSSVLGQLLHQARILLFYYWATLHILSANQPRFQTLQAPPPLLPPLDEAAVVVEQKAAVEDDGQVNAPGKST